MDVVEQNETAVLLHWRGDPGLATMAAGINPRGFGQFNELFRVPAGLPLLVQANLTWPSNADLDLWVVKGDPFEYERRCLSEGGGQILGDDGEESCTYRIDPPLNAWQWWSVFVQNRHNLDSNLRFDAYVRITILAS